MKYTSKQLDEFTQELHNKLCKQFGDTWTWVDFNWSIDNVCLDGHFKVEQLRFIADFMEEKDV